jgi:small subunit ribosomal protein S6
MVRRYELMVILDPNQSDEVIQEQIEKIETLIKSTEGGEILNTDNWGKKRLAYEIQGRPFGIYIVFDFNMDPTGSAELERHCRLDALNLRHLLLHIPVKTLKLKESEKELKSSLEDRRRRMAEASEDAPIVDMLQTVAEEEKAEGEEEAAEGADAEATDAEATPEAEEAVKAEADPEAAEAEAVPEAEAAPEDAEAEAEEAKKEGAES